MEGKSGANVNCRLKPRLKQAVDSRKTNISKSISQRCLLRLPSRFSGNHNFWSHEKSPINNKKNYTKFPNS